MNQTHTVPIAAIIPSYNHESFLVEAIESVLDQTLKPAEVVVIDDLSADKSREILSKYSKHVKVILHERNKGGAETLNTGINNSQSPLIAILNSDDIWEEDKIEKQYEFLNSNRLDACFTRASIMDVNSAIIPNPPQFFSVFGLTEPLGGNFLNHFFYRGNFLCHPSLMAHRDMYKRTGLYKSGLEQLPDFAKWIDFAKSGTIKILPEELTRYRYLPGENASSQKVVQNQIRTKNESFLIFSTFFDGLTRESISHNFSRELDSLSGFERELAGIDPAVALLVSHPEGSLADQALLAGFLRIWKKVNQETNAEQVFLRKALSEITFKLERIQVEEPILGKSHSQSAKHIASKVLTRLRNA